MFATTLLTKAVNNYNDPASNLGWQKAWFAAPGTPDVLATPSDYNLIWNDKGSGAKLNGAVWRPSAPLGYNTIGDLWTSSYNRPANDAMYAIKQGMCEQPNTLYCHDHPPHTECVQQCSETPQLIYADHGTGAKMDGRYMQ